MNKLIIALITILFILGCAGEDKFGVDTEPPHKARLIPHLGDTGDVIIDSVQNYYTNTNNSGIEYNGIDAITDGDKMQIQWEQIIDSDIDFIKIMRFTYEDYLADTLNFATCIDTVDFADQTFYYDDIEPEHIERKLFYFIDVVDLAGNSTPSDTVCYQLMNKPVLTPITNPNSLTFDWYVEQTISAYRILLFNLDHEYVWHYDPQDFDETPIPGPTLSSGNYIWRVDVFSETEFETNPINGNVYTVKAGAESEEREFFIGN